MIVAQVPELAKDEGKLTFTNYKCVIWHEAFFYILDKLAKLSKVGYYHECYDKIMRWLFPIILILSADYEELCMMCLLCGMKSKCPCPVCLAPLEELSDLSKMFPAHTTNQAKNALTLYQQKKLEGKNVFQVVAHSDPEDEASFNDLHYLYLGIWEYHLLEELKILLGKLPHKYATQLENE
ncbi:hypothetical protein J3R83DRAFT_3387 [Lanmaoa asiatica]|nr:hypothetical protein J3R83DRAFT_3387 [Lanmaoa asiatica]